MSIPDFKSSTWSGKFLNAVRGVRVGMHGQSSFWVHLSLAALVVAVGILVNVNLVEWCVLALCITVVLASEMFNSALESLARAVNYDYDPDLADALDIASGAVLLAASGAAAIGVVILGFRAGMWLGWWGGYLLL